MGDAERVTTAPTSPRVTGVCHVFLAYDVGLAIDLSGAERHIKAERETLRHKRRAPPYFEYRPAPLRVSQVGDPVEVGEQRTAATVDIVLYDFGALSVEYRLPFDTTLTELVALSAALSGHPALLADSRQRVARLSPVLAPAISQPMIADFVEPYAVFEINDSTPAARPEDFYTLQADVVAEILRSECQPLSKEEVEDALNHRIAYGVDDVVLIDWDSALLFGEDMDDVLAVLEFANVELLEMRFLDQRLDDALEEAYGSLTRDSWHGIPLPGLARRALRRVAQLQIDNALLFEGVNNALKLLGDQYLARLYRLASRRFHLDEWDSSILRKLHVLESIYEKMSDASTNRRMEVLEWIVILLIATEIGIALLPGLSR